MLPRGGTHTFFSALTRTKCAPLHNCSRTPLQWDCRGVLGVMGYLLETSNSGYEMGFSFIFHDI